MVLEEFKLNLIEDLEPLIKLNPRSLSGKDIGYILLQVNHEEFNTDTPSHLIGLMGKPIASYLKKVCEGVGTLSLKGFPP